MKCETEECCGPGCNCSRCCSNESDCCSGYDTSAMAKMIYKKAMLEMVKDRVKKKLEDTHGKKADKLADLVLEGMEGSKEMKGLMKKKCEWDKKVMETMEE